jgi:HlyD family secretion protein
MEIMIAPKAKKKGKIADKTKGKTALLAALYGIVLAVPVAWIEPEAPARAAANDQADDKRWLAVAPGRVEPSSGIIKVAAPVMAVISAVLVKANDTVFAGEPLIHLADREARAQLAAAEAQVAMRRRVRNKESASSAAAQRRRAEDAVADAEAAIFEVRSLVDRAIAARRAGRGSDAEVEAARSGLTRAQDRLKQQADELRKIEADAPLPTLAEGQLNVARDELQGYRVALEKLTIRAPIGGTILQMNAKVGELASPPATQPLVVLGDISALRVRAEVDERDIGKIKVGQSVLVRPAASREREIAGKVSFVAPLVESGRNSTLSQRNMSDVDVVEVLVDLSEPGPLSVGMKVDVYFRQDSASR